jgi:hypothetical protein
VTDRVPLAEQLDELAAEYTRRCRAYPLLVARGQMRATSMELKLERLAAAHNTLGWLHAHANEIKEWLTYTRKITPYGAEMEAVAMGAPPDVDPIIEPDDAEIIDAPKSDFD